MPLHPTVPARLEPKGYQQITDVSSAVGLTVPKGAQFAKLQAETGDIRWRDDGTSPTGTAGMLLVAGAAPEMYIGDLSALEFVDDGTSVATLNVTYYSV